MKVSKLNLIVFTYFNLFIYIFAFAFHPTKFTGLDYYFLLIVIFLLSKLTFLVFKSPKEDMNWDKKKILFLFGCVTVFSFFTLMDVYVSPLWLDEYTHIMGTFEGITAASAIQQQPPGGYALTRMLGKVLGFGTMTARMTGFVPMLFSLFSLILLQFEKKKEFYFTAFFITVAYCIVPDIRYTSLEGRSVALGVFSMTLVLLALKELCLETSKLNKHLFTISIFLFLNSVGLQPLAMTLLGIGLLPLAYFKEKDKKYLWILLAAGIGLLLFAPLQIDIMDKSAYQEKFHTNYMEQFVGWLKAFNFESYLSYYLVSFQKFSLIWLLLVAGSFSFIKERIKRKFISSFELIVVFFIILWPLLFDLGFHVFVNWTLQPWYFICFSIVALYVFTFQTAHLSKYLLSIIVLGSCYFVATNDVSQKYAEKVNWRPRWEALYQRIEEKKDIDKIYVLGRCEIYSMWCYDIFVGIDFLSKDGGPQGRGYLNVVKMYNDYFIDNGMVHDMMWRNTPTKFSVVITANEDSIKNVYGKLLESKLDGFEVDKLDDFIIITTLEKKMLKDQMHYVLEWIAQTSEQKATAFYPYEMLIWYNYLTKNYEESLKWVDKLLAIPDLDVEFKKHPLGIKKLKTFKEIREKHNL